MTNNFHEQWQKWSQDQVLHVASAYSNPVRWRSRRLLMHDFRTHMQSSTNVVLHAGELAYGDRPFEVTDAADPMDVQLRTGHELWHKENILNLVVHRFPADWKYGAIIDADFHMTRQDWALEAIHQLQHHDWVQLFSSYAPLSAQHRPTRLSPGFAWNYLHADLPNAYGPGATGGAWAFTRRGFDAVGGLLDISILGSADWHMAFGLVGRINEAEESRRYTKAYVRAILDWQERARQLSCNIGYVENHAVHYFHGSYVNRGYSDRWQILVRNEYDPNTDVSRDWQGVLRLNGNKPKLRDDLRRYFRERNEDSLELRGERHLV
jgi:hypothetical protein